MRAPERSFPVMEKWQSLRKGKLATCLSSGSLPSGWQGEHSTLFPLNQRRQTAHLSFWPQSYFRGRRRYLCPHSFGKIWLPQQQNGWHRSPPIERRQEVWHLQNMLNTVSKSSAGIPECAAEQLTRRQRALLSCSFSYTKKFYRIIFVLKVIIEKLYQVTVYIYNYEKQTSKDSYPDERRRIICILAGKMDWKEVNLLSLM